MICVARSCRGASGSVTAMTIAKAAPSAPDENHLCPSITHSSPSCTARVCSSVGSEPAPPRPGAVRRGRGGGPSPPGLGHRKKRRDLARHERREPALLLLVGAESPEDL